MLGSFTSCPLSPFTKLCILDPVFIHQNMSSHMGASDIFSKLCKGGTTDPSIMKIMLSTFSIKNISIEKG